MHGKRRFTDEYEKEIICPFYVKYGSAKTKRKFNLCSMLLYDILERHNIKLNGFENRDQTGENNPNWKNGTSIYSHKRYIKLRKEVLQHDSYTCRLCGNENCNLVHHIYNINDYPEFAFDEDNLMTVCKRHHQNIHKREIRHGVNR